MRPEERAQRAGRLTREDVEHLSLTMERTAEVLEASAALADEHAERLERAGRSDDAAKELRSAARAREGAERARSLAKEWLRSAGDQQE